MKSLKNEALKTMATIVRSIKGWTMLFALVLPAAILTPHPVAAQAATHRVAAHAVTLVATINGFGTAEMQGPVLLGTTVFGWEVKLYSDGTARGELQCTDLPGGTSPGIVWGQVNSWSRDVDGNIVLKVNNYNLVSFPKLPGEPADSGPLTVTIQKFGGAGVGHWTMAIPDGSGGWFTVCVELLTKGHVDIHYAHTGGGRDD